MEQPKEDDPVEVPVPSDHVVLVDREDWPRIARYKWRVVKRGVMLYAATDYKGRTFYLHRTIMRVPVGDLRRVDHRDSNGLDCRKSNLRMATFEQNNQNVNNRQKGVTGYTGVELNAQGTYTARIRTGAGRERKYIGTYKTAEAAARAYDAEAIRLRGEFAVLNFKEGQADGGHRTSEQCIVGTGGHDTPRGPQRGTGGGVGEGEVAAQSVVAQQHGEASSPASSGGCGAQAGSGERSATQDAHAVE